jgi:hypothetical protein
MTMPDFVSTPAGLFRLVTMHASANLLALRQDDSAADHAGVCRPLGDRVGAVWITGGLDEQTAAKLLDYLEDAIENPTGPISAGTPGYTRDTRQPIKGSRTVAS